MRWLRLKLGRTGTVRSHRIGELELEGGDPLGGLASVGSVDRAVLKILLKSLPTLAAVHWDRDALTPY